LSEIVSLDGLLQSKLALLLCYPRYDSDEAERRLRELRSLGVEGLEFRGMHRIGEMPVLGKGHVGVVVAARFEGASAALKIRRVDADRESLDAEAENLRTANRVSVGPRLLGASDNFLLMELMEGKYLTDWVGGLHRSDEGRLRGVLRHLFDKARRLDSVGLDHGELSSAHRHVIVVGDEPRIIDFESASAGRRVANVTSIANYIYFNNLMRGLVEGMLPGPRPDALIEALRHYKWSPTDSSYSRLLDMCGLGA